MHIRKVLSCDVILPNEGLPLLPAINIRFIGLVPIRHASSAKAIHRQRACLGNSRSANIGCFAVTGRGPIEA